MMVSKAGIGMYGFLLSWVLHAVGIDIDEGQATEFVLAVFTAVSTALWIYGQFDRKDVRFGVLKEPGV